MKIVFFGSGRFAVPALERIYRSGHEIVCVVTQPDRKAGRGLVLSPTPIKKVSGTLNLRLYQAQEANAAGTQELLVQLQPDLLCVVAFGQILSGIILAAPRLMAINLHASLLPKYRGAAPVNWALINGERQTGVSVIKMVQKMDAGPLILQKSLGIEESDDALSLEGKLAVLGADLLLEALGLISAGKCRLIEQNEAEANFAPKLKKEHGLIDWHDPAAQIFNRVRGCARWPGAYTYYKGRALKLHKVKVMPEAPAGETAAKKPSPGEVLTICKQGLTVASAKGYLLIEELQPEGRRRMTAADFITGHKISVGDLLGDKI